MEANELRIGNYLQGREVVRVAQILGESTVGLDCGGNPYHVHTEEPFKPCLLPIKITKEWLLKLGFRQFVTFFGVEFVGGMFLVYRNGKIQLEATHSTPILRFDYIKNVHQLQNLYFALTGKELTLIN